uniref:Uncharacterized protein n=1 Tax=Callorhinchus milii TaxID=7868 RepID=A0A4W3GQL9_CALMI
ALLKQGSVPIPIKLQGAARGSTAKPGEDSEAEDSEVEDGDTLDPQTGLFYRSHTAAQLPHTALLQLREAVQGKPTALQAVSGAVPQGITVKPQQQLPKVLLPPQPTPTQPPPTQAPPTKPLPPQPPPERAVKHQPTSSEQQPPTQAQPPIITQGATVTKITFGNCQATTITKATGGNSEAKAAATSTSYYTVQSSKKLLETDILKISMMEAKIGVNDETSGGDPNKDKRPASTTRTTSPSPSQKLTPILGLKEQPNKPPPPRIPPSPPPQLPPPPPTTQEKSLPSGESEEPGKPGPSHFLQMPSVTQDKSELSADILIQVSNAPLVTALQRCSAM